MSSRWKQFMPRLEAEEAEHAHWEQTHPPATEPMDEDEEAHT